ncbi:MAG: cyclodeaminase/cyclohydrolase family protein [Phycisphaerae bacterium]|jgi:glutamate formiminotransferase/formiminotetrahydrofolate cyclodeaminase|nr:cyclodeaminase/cyclohydrolase family protein [Phycisphaerae bacterium]
MTSTSNILKNSVEEFISATGAKSPTPGGGSVAGVVGALGVALGRMTLNFSKGKKNLAQHEAYYAELEQRLETACAAMVNLVSDDIAAYQAYQQANRLPDGDDKTRAVTEATARAIDVPRQTTQTALGLLTDMKELAGKCNKWLITDLLAAGALAVAAATLSDYNVRINLPNLADQAQAEEIRNASRDDLDRARAIHAETEEATRDMLP